MYIVPLAVSTNVIMNSPLTAAPAILGGQRNAKAISQFSSFSHSTRMLCVADDSSGELRTADRSGYSLLQTDHVINVFPTCAVS